jgi:hypothetical protein
MFDAMRRLLLLACLGATVAARPDRRIVDRVTIGDARSEHEHAAAKGAGWVRYALNVFDDTEVTVSCTFAGTTVPRTFDLIVENKMATTHTFNSRDSATVEFRVPLSVTEGRTNILVMLKATKGPVPALISLRSVQDHNE